MSLLGAHVSIAGGIKNAIARGEEIGCEAIQIFTDSSRTWALRTLGSEDAVAFKKARGVSSIQKVIVHNSYLLNLSTPNKEIRNKSIKYFISNFERCESLSVESLVTHPGSHLGVGLKEGVRQTIKCLNAILKTTSGYKTQLLIENTAGQGDCVGSQFQELAEIIGGVSDPERIHCCFDTQHAFAAGYEMRTREAYEKLWDEWDKLIGVAKVKAFHLNDAVKDIGSRVDRHQALGEGFLGVEPFRWITNDPRFKKVPMCLETDPGEKMANFRRELSLLHSIRKDPF